MRLHSRRTCSAIALACALQCFGQTKVDLKTQTKSVDFSGASSTKPVQLGTVLPSTCSQGQFFFLTTAPAGQNVFGCSATNVWSLEGSAVPVSSLLPTLLNNAGKLLTTDGVNPLWQTATGDVTGTPTALTVGGLLGRKLSTSAPSDGQLLKFNATTGVWEPIGLAGDVSGPPATLQVAGLRGRGLSTAAPADGQLLKFNGTSGQWEPVALSGDVAGAPAALTVSGLQGRKISNALPGNGQLLAWSASSSSWAPTAVQIPPNFGGTFSASSTLSIPGTQHNLNTPNLIVSCYDNSTPANMIEPSRVTVDPVTYNVTVTFANPQSGNCVLNGSGGVGLGATALTGTATLTFPSIANAACSSELTIAVPGAIVGNGIAEGWPALPSGLIGAMRVSVAGVVAVRMCNLSGASAVLSPLVYTATIVRGF